MVKAEMILMDIPWECRFGREVQQGIYRYARSDRQWWFARMQFCVDNRWLRYANTVGMISARPPEEYIPQARRYNLSAVGVGRWSSSSDYTGLAYVDVDPKALGEMAAEYFINRGFRNFGMIAMDDQYHSAYRGEAFVAALRRRKIPCDTYDYKRKYPLTGEPLPSIAKASESICRWLMGLSKPLAVFCIDDAMGLWLCDVCRWSGIHVPEEVAILGADNDSMFCEMAHTHLSSIQVPAEQVGFEAARLLDAIMSGKKVPKRPVLLPPMEVVTRQSTDVLVIEDLYVTRAIRYIREHAHEGIFVKDIIAEVHLSRRPLERRFQKALGRSPFAEIRRVQIEKVKMLLTQTDKTLEAMAPKCGFKTVTRMNMAFKKDTGMPPGAYRKQFRSQ